MRNIAYWGRLPLRRLPLRRLLPDPARLAGQDPSPAELQPLCDSIRAAGLLEPLVVRKTPAGWRIVAGVRRWQAAGLLGIARLPCLVIRTTDAGAALLAFAHNFRRTAPDFWEVAETTDRLVRRYALAPEDVARSLGIAPSVLAEKRALTGLTGWQRDRARAAGLAEGHVRALLAAPPDKRDDVLLQVIADQLTPAQTLALACPAPPAAEKAAPCRKSLLGDLRPCLNSLDRTLHTICGAGVPATARVEETDAALLYTVVLPKPHSREPAVAVGENLKLFV